MLASPSPTKRQAPAQPEERSETLAQPSWLEAQLGGLQGELEDPVSAGTRRLPGEPGITTVWY